MRVNDEEALAARAEALWRAITFVSVAALHLQDNPLLRRPLEPSDVKAGAGGHWGTVPGTAWVLAHLGLLEARPSPLGVTPVLGAGHAGVVQLALAWLTGDLARVRPAFCPYAAGLARLVAAFPLVEGLGSETHPSLPVGSHLGGLLGGALAFAQGLALDTHGQVVVPILGDGECETPTTSAAWLAHRELGASTAVLPIVQVNGQRMGGVSLLGSMSDEQLRAYARGVGWTPRIVHVGEAGDLAEHAAFHQALEQSLEAVLQGDHQMIFMRCVKGWSGPAAHKTPLTDARHDPGQRLELSRWLASYRPAELLDESGHPLSRLAQALHIYRLAAPSSGDRSSERVRPDAGAADAQPTLASHCPAVGEGDRRGGSFAAHIGAVLSRHAQAGDFRVFSPDELASNRLAWVVRQAWAHEVLAEEVLLGWLAGWTASGRRGVLISYEAFASLLLAGLVAHLKQRRLVSSPLPSLNVLLTSYGWQNVYTHGDPSLITAMVGLDDPAVHVFTPADPARTAVALDDALLSRGQINIIIAGKHATTHYPLSTVDEERRQGLAVWPHLSDDDPDLVLAFCGDLPAAAACEAAVQIRARYGCRVRLVAVHELTALRRVDLDRLVGDRAAVVVATLGHPAAVWALLGGRLRRPCAVVGWREPSHPVSQRDLAARAGLDVDGLVASAGQVLTGRQVAR